jgi:tRNA U55 pseudouridine synthase TruB
MHTLESLAAQRARAEPTVLLALDAPLGHLPAVRLGPQQARRLCQGQAVSAPDAPPEARVRLYEKETFLGIGETDSAGAVHPRRLMRLEPTITDAP